jgi:hypothetical protein
MMGMRFLDCSQHETIPHRSRQLFQSLFVESSIKYEPYLVFWSESKKSSETISGRIENASYMGSSEDVNVVSELMDEIQAATVDCQVSSEARSLSGIRVTNEYSPLNPHPAYPGESPPPAPRACFGREELIEGIVGFAANLTPIALIGAGGIGKTSIVLTVLHPPSY